MVEKPELLDWLAFGPDDVDLSRSPLAGSIGAETYTLGAFNPGLTRLPNGNLLMIVRVAEALRTPIRGDMIHAIRWEAGTYRLDAWPLDQVDTRDPRKFLIRGNAWRVMALTSLSWLLPVELSADGGEVIAVHYEHAIAPTQDYQCYGVEDARISKVGERYLMTTCSVSPERHCTTLYTSADALHWELEGIVLDHQNKDMVIFEGQPGGRYWAQTRPLGDLYFAYPPGSPWQPGPAINLSTSPDALHWKPYEAPGIRPSSGDSGFTRMGGGAPPIETPEGWLTLWHGVEPADVVGIYRTYWSLLDRDDPSVVLRSAQQPVLQAAPHLTEPLRDQMYVQDVVFTTGIADHGDRYVVASGEADLVCRITHLDKRVFA